VWVAGAGARNRGALARAGARQVRSEEAEASEKLAGAPRLGEMETARLMETKMRWARGGDERRKERR
jgi:hypothetical protein